MEKQTIQKTFKINENLSLVLTIDESISMEGLIGLSRQVGKIKTLIDKINLTDVEGLDVPRKTTNTSDKLGRKLSPEIKLKVYQLRQKGMSCPAISKEIGFDYPNRPFGIIKLIEKNLKKGYPLEQAILSSWELKKLKGVKNDHN